MNRTQIQTGLSLSKFMELNGTEEKSKATLQNTRWADSFRSPHREVKSTTSQVVGTSMELTKLLLTNRLLSIVQRVQIVLAYCADETHTAIVKRMGLKGMNVGNQRRRYRVMGLEGLQVELRPDRPRTSEDDKVAELINRTLQNTATDEGTHWRARTLVAATRIAKPTVLS